MSDYAAKSPAWASFARAVIELAVSGGDVGRATPPESAAADHGGVFVTLKKSGRLRGCMGRLDPDEPPAEAVRLAAQSAALNDPRFPPVAADELAELTLDVSILSRCWPMNSVDELQLGVHGVIVRKGMQRGLFLPQVAVEHRLDKDAFLSRCCSEKAGLAPDAWKQSDTEVRLFTTELFTES